MILDNEKNRTYLIACLIFLISLGLYVKTLAPSIWWEDSGELTTSPYTLGITHPPGYPLYTILNKILITLVPVSNIGFRGNMANAYWGALSIMLVYLIVLKMEKKFINEKKLESKILLGGHLPAVVAAFLTNTAAIMWLYSITSEEYTLNLFLMMLCTFLFLVWEEKKDIRYMFLISLIYGLSFAHHQEAILFFPAFLYFGLITDARTIFNWKNVIAIVLLFILGLSAYAYMPIRGAQHPYLNWGTPYTWDGFKFSVKRDQYGPLQQMRELRVLFSQLNLYGFIEQFNVYIFFFSFIGIWRMFRKNLKYSVFLLLATFCSAVGFVYLVNPPDPGNMFNLLRKFYLPLYALCAMWISFGLSFVWEKIYYFMNKIKPVKQTVWSFALIPFFLSPLTNLFTHYKTYDYHKVYFTYDFTYNMANSVEKDSIVWGYLSNDTFTWWFYNFAEGRRPDIINIHQRMITLPWYYQQTMDNYPDLIMTNNEFLDWHRFDDLIFRSVVFTKNTMTHNPNHNYYYTMFSYRYLPRSYNLTPKGIVFLDTGGPNDQQFDEKVWLNYRYRGLEDAPRCIRSVEVLGTAERAHLYLGQKYMTEEKFELAIYHYQLAVRFNPKSEEALYNLGFAYYRTKREQSAVREFERFLAVAPNSHESNNIRGWLNFIKPKLKAMSTSTAQSHQ